jgi:hypothetical protein
MKRPLSRVVAACLALTAPALAFNGHLATNGPLSLAIAPVPVVTNFNSPRPAAITLSNSSAGALVVKVQMRLIDDMRAVGETAKRVTVPPRGTAAASFQFACGPGTYSAHYPLHVDAEFDLQRSRVVVHAVQIFETDFSSARLAAATNAPFSIVSVPSSGALALTALKTQRVAWAYTGGEVTREAAGWSGNVPSSRASFSRGPVTRGGENRNALHMHPPYVPRAGTVFAEYRLKLPPTKPLRLTFFNAIRDSTPKEGTSDGVTFRVWADDQTLFERHTDTKTWLPGEADLSTLAGREILLRLESHPGPKNNTACDSAFWGDPVIIAGNAPRILTAAEKSKLGERARQIVATGKADGTNGHLFQLADGCRAGLVPGPNGIVDSAIAFGDATRVVAMDGIQVSIRDQPLGQWPSGATCQFDGAINDIPGRTRIMHRGTADGREFTLMATVWADGAGLRVKVETVEPISLLGAGPFDRKADRVFYGHGYCIVDPEPFRASAGGHNLASSHVGFDFTGGVSLLTASDTPVDALRVDPPNRIYQLQTHPNSTLTFVPGVKGAFDCAFKFRPLSEKKAAPAVARKAGRFVFDIWGGKYAEDTAKLRRCFDYGLTNSLVIMHVWQRWGYDYRLPDIFPPLPANGTLEELRALGELCAQRGALWGLHDNYIDIYPDAAGFSYDHVTFSDGRPRRAWNNEGRQAQSYQFRPDHIMPFLRRNMELIVPALKPGASFVDVFTSLHCMDFQDRFGQQHSKLETQRHWGEAFDYIRRACGNNAPTTSEAGSDQLIGWLDGADCQFLQLSPKGGAFLNQVACREWARVPWFDAVHHRRFSLHGVGYPGRYEGGRSRENHGIESDDYLSAEILIGHDLMIDLGGMVRGAVRKHWLAQDFIERIAMDDIAGVEFAGGNIQRPIVTWKSGARVFVNRGETDWHVDGRLLPQFGYYAKHGATESSVERIGDAIAEQSRGPGKFYVNGRGHNPNAPLPVTPAVERLETLGPRRFKLVVNWDVQQPFAKEFAVNYTFSRPTPGKRAMTEFNGGGMPNLVSNRWQGRVVTGGDWAIDIPTNIPPGDYEILAALVDPKSRSRQRVLGDEDNSRRCRIGRLIVEGTGRTNITGVRLEKPEKPFVPSNRWLANKGAVDFGVARTTGAFRCEIAPKRLVVTPLPDGSDATAQLRLDRIAGAQAQLRSVQVIDATGAPTGPASFTANGAQLDLPMKKSDFGYLILLR